jgi:hypothetical protein
LSGFLPFFDFLLGESWAVFSRAALGAIPSFAHFGFVFGFKKYFFQDSTCLPQSRYIPPPLTV